MDFCKRYPLCAYAVVSSSRVLFTRLRCGSWSCEYCAGKNRDIWQAHLLTTLPEMNDHWYLITLTAHEHRRSADMSLANIRQNIDRLLKRLRRIYKHVEYVRIYEKHPTSEARHAHLVASGLSPFVAVERAHTGNRTFVPLLERSGHRGTWTINTWFKRAARECGMGYQVKCEAVSNATKSVGYAVKYLTKSAQDLHEKGLRHVQTSRGIGSPQPESEYKWHVCSYVTAKDFHAGTSVIDLQTGEEIPPDYWADFDAYPPENN
jgi:hypothetical protein